MRLLAAVCFLALFGVSFGFYGGTDVIELNKVKRTSDARVHFAFEPTHAPRKTSNKFSTLSTFGWLSSMPRVISKRPHTRRLTPHTGCGHCKSLKPTWEKVAADYKGILKVAAVNCDEDKELAQQFGIQGFPTIKFFPSQSKNGRKEPQDYQVLITFVARPLLMQSRALVLLVRLQASLLVSFLRSRLR